MKMFLKILLGCALIFSVGITEVRAQTITTYANVKSDYSFPEFGFTQYDGAVLQGGVTASFENGFFLDIWGSEPFSGNQQGREYDYTVGWAGDCGTYSCGASVSLFDIPTPDIGDFDFTGTDIIRFRATIDRTFQLNDQNSINMMLGADQLTGLIEVTMPRVAASWNHQLTDNWSINALWGATYNTGTDYTSPRWELSATRSFETWSLSIGAAGFDPMGSDSHHATYNIGASRSW